jgi:hypothetical protein
MSVSLEQLESFHRFAQQKVQVGEADSIAELAREWEIAQDREDVNEAIREAMEDFKAGRFRPAADVSRDMRRKYNLPITAATTSRRM